MRRGSLRALVATAAAVLIAAVLASCGNGGSAATGAGPSSETTAEDTVAATSNDQIRTNVKTGPLHVTQGGPAMFPEVPDNYTTLTADKESTLQALEEAARVVHEYLVAHVQYDWEASCSYLDKHAREEVTILGSHFKQVAGKDCPTIIAYLLGKVPAQRTAAASEVDAGVFRVRREGGHLFYKGGGDVYTVNLSREDDGLKLDEILVVKISP